MRCARRSLWLNVNQKVLHAHVNQATDAQALPLRSGKQRNILLQRYHP